MKLLSCILLLSLVCPVLAKDPDELVKLREVWEDSLSEIKRSTQERFKYKTQEANKLYYEELQEMKSNFMKAENLQGANAVDAEIKKLVAEHGKQKFDTKVTQLDGVWLTYLNKKPEPRPKYLRIFKGDLMVSDSMGGFQTHPVSIEANEITISLPAGGWEKLKRDPYNPDLMIGVSSGGLKVTYERLKW